LVEDQVARLRKAVRRIAAGPAGKQLFVGRYTSATLGRGALPTSASDKRLSEVAREVRSIVSEYDAMQRSSDVDLSQFSDPRQGEMLTRWDMIAHPPDLMVTHYSMLNAMLMRDLEEPIFAATRDWLAGDERNVFSLVVDELHLYRGTQGSEMAMNVRNLLNRFGLEPDSPQMRCIATSASLTDDERGLGYLEQFFGVDRSSFFVTAGQPRQLDASLPISRARVLELPAMASEERQAHAFELELPAAAALACRSNGTFRATALPAVAERLFDELDEDGAALEAALRALSELPAGDRSVPLRAHMFVRTLRGVWACTNPSCDQVDREEPLGIGRLFSIPASTCRCGGRVLELLYCFECGDISLGGYVAGHLDEATFLTSAPTEVPLERAAPIFMRSHQHYRPEGTVTYTATGLQELALRLIGRTPPAIAELGPGIGPTEMPPACSPPTSSPRAVCQPTTPSSRCAAPAAGSTGTRSDDRCSWSTSPTPTPGLDTVLDDGGRLHRRLPRRGSPDRRPLPPRPEPHRPGRPRLADAPPRLGRTDGDRPRRRTVATPPLAQRRLHRSTPPPLTSRSTAKTRRAGQFPVGLVPAGGTVPTTNPTALSIASGPRARRSEDGGEVEGQPDRDRGGDDRDDHVARRRPELAAQLRELTAKVSELAPHLTAQLGHLASKLDGEVLEILLRRDVGAGHGWELFEKCGGERFAPCILHHPIERKSVASGCHVDPSRSGQVGRSGPSLRSVSDSVRRGCGDDRGLDR
jgi:hypothetical protein